MQTDLVSEVSRKELQKIAIVGTHLHSWQGKNQEDILRVFHQQGKVQLDPLNPAGRNHDIFFAARIKEYKINDFQKIVYPQKEVFECYFPNLMAIAKEYFPIFLPHMKKKYLHKHYQSRIKKLEESNSNFLEQAISFLEQNGPSKAADMKELAEIKPEIYFWKTSNLAGMSLEILWLLGKAVIYERDEHWRKKYGLIEGYFDSSMLSPSKFSDDEINYRKFLLKQKSYPLVNLGRVSYSEKKGLSFGRRRGLSPKWFLDMSDSDKPKILKVQDEEIYCGVPGNWKEMLEKNYDEEMRVLAPLDPLIWDRDLTLKVLDFDYVWEVYKIPKDRKWGYYVFPLLFKGQFFGRIEANFNKKEKILHLFNLQLEENQEFTNVNEHAFTRLVDRWKYMLSAEEVTTDKSIKFL